MSYTFSRRAFLKYSAATAVAVAGASLLGGCEYQDPNNPVSKALPSAITSELQVIGGLRGLKIENGTCTMEVDIESGRANPIPLDPYRFSLAIKDAEGKQVYFSGNNGGVKITDAENSLIVKKTPITLHLEAVKFRRRHSARREQVQLRGGFSFFFIKARNAAFQGRTGRKWIQNHGQAAFPVI